MRKSIHSKRHVDIKLTEYSHGAGCGCKIAPAVLDDILSYTDKHHRPRHASLLVGHEHKDDAAVYDLGNGRAIISTTDFFMPIVDDPFDFGRIAAANALSDVYAMAGTPLMAIAILGWPVDKIPGAVAGTVLRGAEQACEDAGIPLAGGHSIDSPEPIFGLAVTGEVPVAELKRNSGARPGDLLFLSKPLGVGIFTTAQKTGILQPAHAALARDSMIQLNTLGAQLGDMAEVHAMTDVTGFGLGGHLVEMCLASDTAARLTFENLPLLNEAALTNYFGKKAIPGGTRRNFDSYGHLIAEMSDFQRTIICDPQTSGGLLIATAPESVDAFTARCRDHGTPVWRIGQMLSSQTGAHRITLH